MSIPYRTRRLLGRILTVIVVVAVVLAVIWACWLLWLQRYVVYSRDEGAVFRFDLDAQVSQGELAVPPEEQTVPIYYNEGDAAVTASQELTKVVGYYIDEAALKSDINAVYSQIKALEKGTPVMVDVKNIYGKFFYSSSVNDQRSDSIDPEQMDALLEFLDSSGMYTIARFPALRDYYYGLNNVPDGVPHSSGGYLYQDDAGCYWLNPDSSGTLSFIVDIIQELKGLGFDEVVLTDFRFPQTDSILYSGDKTQALANAANTLLTTCGSASFGVSFVGDGSWTLPEGRSRLYMEDVDASDVDEAAESSGVADLETKLVFITGVHDTRFDTYGVLRPLATAH